MMIFEKGNGLLRGGGIGKQLCQHEAKTDSAGIFDIGAENTDIDTEAAAGLGNER